MREEYDFKNARKNPYIQKEKTSERKNYVKKKIQRKRKGGIQKICRKSCTKLKSCVRLYMGICYGRHYLHFRTGYPRYIHPPRCA